MLDEKIDVGEADEEATEIDLDAPAEKPEPEEEKIEVQEEEAPVEKTEDGKPAEQKEELSEYSDGVQKRIAKLTRKMREAERQKEEAITFARTQKDEAERIKKRYDSLDNSYTQEFEKRVTTNLAATKQKLAAAINSGDVEAQVNAQAELSALTMDANKLARIKDAEAMVSRKTTEAPVNAPKTQAPPQRPPDPKADAWARNNSWFGTDNAMTYTAFDIHKKLVEEEGFDASTDEYYSEVDKRIRLEFPHKFDTNRDTAADGGEIPTQNVASAKRPAKQGRRKTVKLTPSQVAISKRLGVPLEEYAKQLAAKEV